MQLRSLHRSPLRNGALAVVAAALLAFAGLGAGTSLGQAPPSATATPAAPPAASGPQPAPALDNDTAVRIVLPSAESALTTLPGKWARADLPNAPGGYVVFISTIYPQYDDSGNVTYYLLVNYLQWNGTQWLIGKTNYAGAALTGDDVWLAQNLSDISAYSPPSGQTYQAVTVYYSATGQVSPSLARTESVVEIYDLTPATVWSRVYSLHETDTSNASYAEARDEDADWTFKDVDGSGVDAIVATITDSDSVFLNAGVTPGAGIPQGGTTTVTTTEIWKWRSGVYYLLSSQVGSAPPTAAAPIAATSTAVAPTAAATAPARGVPAAPPLAAPSTPSPTPTGRPAG